ncbi:hypothetical protein [Enterovibrio baiacu]|uniref:hypothetical protein n=1 Tax=Enterovibrio baiacu TaxID=2491023 RepID=UPI003D13F6F8
MQLILPLLFIAFLPVILLVYLIKVIFIKFDYDISDEAALFLVFCSPIVAIVIIALVRGNSYKEHESLVFNPIYANTLSDKEKVATCHALIGFVNSQFDYYKEGNFIYKDKSHSERCDFTEKEIHISELKVKALNSCNTLTKAEISRGAVPTYTEYKPQYSPYKNGMIYWRCSVGGKPKHSSSYEKISSNKLYRYQDDQNILLLKGDYDFYYYFKDKLIRKVAFNGIGTNYKNLNITTNNIERLNNKPTLLD